MNQLSIRNVAPAEILEMMLALEPNAARAMQLSSAIGAQILPYQAAALYWLASDYNLDGSHIVEIGTYHGYSASIIAQAAKRAQVMTLNPNATEMALARNNLAAHINVTAIAMASWDYYPAAPCNLDMVFVDGNHKRAKRDLPWWNLIAFGGLMLFHDYTEVGCMPVVAAVDSLCAMLHKDGPDVVLIDSNGVGMAGVYKDRYIGWPGVR